MPTGRALGIDRILVVSACSGHGFKHLAGIGEYVAQVLDGEDSLRPAFALDRLALEPFRMRGHGKPVSS